MIAAIRSVAVLSRTAVVLPRSGRERASTAIRKGPKPNVNWADLIGRVASERDREAFKSLFDHFAPRIKGFMIKAGSDADEAEEIAQETMIAVWRKASQFDPVSTGAAAWIYTIARNLRIDHVRRAARIGKLGRATELESETDPTASADTLILRVEDTSRVRAALESLSSEQSKVIRLSFIEERPHPDIAELLQIPLGTVKSRIRLAMNRLRDLLDEEQ